MTCCRNKCGLIVLLLDFLLQNALMFLFFYYYFTQNFINIAAKKSYLAFLIIYTIVTVIPRFASVTFYRIYDENNPSCCKKFWGYWLVVILGLIHAEYLWIILFYRF